MDCEALYQIEEGAAPESRLDVDEISPSVTVLTSSDCQLASSVSGVFNHCMPSSVEENHTLHETENCPSAL